MPVYLAQEKMRQMLEGATLDKDLKLVYEHLSTFVDAVIISLGEAEDGAIKMGAIDATRKKVLEVLNEQKRTASIKQFESYADQAVQQVQLVINAIDLALENATEEDLEDLDFYLLVSTSVPILEEALDQHLQSFTP